MSSYIENHYLQDKDTHLAGVRNGRWVGAFVQAIEWCLFQAFSTRTCDSFFVVVVVCLFLAKVQLDQNHSSTILEARPHGSPSGGGGWHNLYNLVMETHSKNNIQNSALLKETQ